ncbi:MAG: hypothetical protein FWF18_02355 [Dehalococcoidia bacterium]|nr:hypothetical protein [Dehalococcoidia bacterium]
MAFDNNVFLFQILVLAVIGVGLSVLLLIVLQKANKKISLRLRSYAVGFGVCVTINIFILVISFGFLGIPAYIVLCGPLMIFGFMLTKKLIKDTKLSNPFVNFILKSIATVLIWFMAFFPFSLIGVIAIANLPAETAKKQEILQLQEEILNYDTYADLTPFGLGIYKLQNNGDRNLWDITKPQKTVINIDGVDMVYENHINRRDDDTWDNAWGNSNEGKDVVYDVIFYEDTYIIIAPLWEQPGRMYYWGYIYLCKEINEKADLFGIGILDTEVVEKLQELPGEKVSRKELAEKLGKTF